MVQLRMFFDFEVEVLEIFEGFKAWFLQSLCTLKCFWIFSDAACTLDIFVCRNALGKLLFIRVWGWMSDMWQSLIRDMCHSMIGWALRHFLQEMWHLLIGRNDLIFKVTHVSTQLDCLRHCLHTPSCLDHHLHALMCNWFLHAFMPLFQRNLANFYWFLSNDSKI